jgi:hypothetical protein
MNGEVGLVDVLVMVTAMNWIGSRKGMWGVVVFHVELFGFVGAESFADDDVRM